MTWGPNLWRQILDLFRESQRPPDKQTSVEEPRLDPLPAASLDPVSAPTGTSGTFRRRIVRSSDNK